MPGTVQINCLGGLGRFGNQLFQYAVAKGYARKVGAVLETPAWIGQQIFEIDDPKPSKNVPSTQMDEVPQDGRDTINLHGYYQHSQAFELYNLDDLRSWFKFRPWVFEELHDYKPVHLAAHVRRGDYATTYLNAFCVVDEASYRTAMVKFGFRPEYANWISDATPNTFKRPGLEWLLDFWTLCWAENLFRANSTFSWWAGTLGSHKRIFAPVIEGKRGFQSNIMFTEGNWPRCTDQPNVHNYTIP